MSTFFCSHNISIVIILLFCVFFCIHCFLYICLFLCLPCLFYLYHIRCLSIFFVLFTFTSIVPISCFIDTRMIFINKTLYRKQDRDKNICVKPKTVVSISVPRLDDEKLLARISFLSHRVVSANKHRTMAPNRRESKFTSSLNGSFSQKALFITRPSGARNSYLLSG